MPLAASVRGLAREVSFRDGLPVEALSSCLNEIVILLSGPGRRGTVLRQLMWNMRHFPSRFSSKGGLDTETQTQRLPVCTGCRSTSRGRRPEGEPFEQILQRSGRIFAQFNKGNEEPARACSEENGHSVADQSRRILKVIKRRYYY